MTRFILSCFFYTLIARWGYAEISILSPQIIPLIDESLTKFQIPTHDKWSRKAGIQYLQKLLALLDDDSQHRPPEHRKIKEEPSKRP